MQLLAAINELSHRRVLVGIALVVSLILGMSVAYKISPGLPPHVASRQHKVGVASTRVLINTPSSIVADLNPNGGSSLSTHAQLLGNLLASDQVRSEIARSAGIAPSDLVVSPLAVGGVIQTPLATSTPAPAGASTLSVNADPLLPLITIDVQAPTPKQAAALANGSVNVLQSYIQSVAADESIPTSRRPVITSLGAAQGISKATGPSKMYGVIAVLILFGLSCYVILVATGARRRLRELRTLDYETLPALRPPGDITTADPTYSMARQPAADRVHQLASDTKLATIADDLEQARNSVDGVRRTAPKSRAVDHPSRAESVQAETATSSAHATASYHRGTVAVRPGYGLLRRFNRG
jgi:hypothetical protein